MKPSWNQTQIDRFTQLISENVFIGYWCSDQFGFPVNGGTHNYQPVYPGLIQEVQGPLAICTQNALHATLEPHKWKGSRVWVIALFGEIKSDRDKEEDNKYASLKREIIGEILPHEAFCESVGVRLGRKDLSYSNLYGANLYGADFYKSDFSYANLVRANLYRADLTGANLAGANLAEANLYGADLTGANLSYANLSYTNISRANANGARFIGANLNRTNCLNTNFYAANLSGACISYVNLIEADITGADFNFANLTEVTMPDNKHKKI